MPAHLLIFSKLGPSSLLCIRWSMHTLSGLMLWVRPIMGPAFMQQRRTTSVHFAAERAESIPALKQSLGFACIGWVDNVVVYEITNMCYPTSHLALKFSGRVMQGTLQQLK